jgi:hypothetical protein
MVDYVEMETENFNQTFEARIYKEICLVEWVGDLH